MRTEIFNKRHGNAFRIGLWLVDKDARRLQHNGLVRTLEPLPMNVLLLLVDKAGEVVSTDVITTAIWGEHYVGESPVAHAVTQIRKALGDNPRSPQFIETVPKAGYRLIATVAPAQAHGRPQEMKQRLFFGVGAFAIVAAAAVFRFASVGFVDDHSSNTTGPPIVVVLPLTNLTGEARNDRIAFGIAEELRYALQEIQGVAVIDPHSTEVFLEQATAPGEALGLLGATHTLSGSLQGQGDVLRALIRLIDNGRGVDVFTIASRVEKRDILSSQMSIAAMSARQLSEHLGATAGVREDPPAMASFRSTRGQRQRAYQSYLDGRVAFASDTKDASITAERLFEDAVASDPSFQRAWLALTETRFSLLSRSYVDKETGYQKAIDSSDALIRLAPNAPAGWAFACRLRVTQKQEIDAAKPFCNRARELGPQTFIVQVLMSELALMEGDLDQALRYCERAVVLDPLNPRIQVFLAFILFLNQQLAAAESTVVRAMKLAPQVGMAQGVLGHIALARGQHMLAVSFFEAESVRIYGLAGLAISHYRSDDRTLAELSLAQMQAQFAKDAPFQIAEIYGARGETGRAIDWLRRAYAEQDAGLTLMKTSPYLDAIRNDPGYLDLAAKLSIKN